MSIKEPDQNRAYQVSANRRLTDAVGPLPEWASLLDEPRFRASEVRCPYCGEDRGQPCVGASGVWFANRPHKGRILTAEKLPPRRCYAYEWCQHTNLTRLSYGDGKPYWRCSVGHVWPTPPPPDIAVLDAEEDW